MKNEKTKVIKESSARRKERLQFATRLTTKVVQSKKVYNRNKIKRNKESNENDY